jgi:hypothetical protein
MGATQWIGENWIELLQTIGIVGGSLLAAYTTRKDEQARKISNSIAISEQYRQIWKDIYDHPQLARVLEKDTDVVAEPVSVGEEMFVTTIVAHLSTVFRAMKHGEFVELEGLQKDVRDFFALPIPKAVWAKLKPLQDANFTKFIETTLG